MFVGHFAVAMAAKARTPRLSLGVLFIAGQALDLIWPVLVLAGIEQVKVDHSATEFTPLDFVSYPWSHSLLMTLLWSLVAFGIAKFARRSVIECTMLALLVASHWILDFLTHRPDLPLWPSGPKVGIGLWNSEVGTLIVELLLFAASIAVYLRVRPSTQRKRPWVFWSLICFLTLVYFANAFGPPPPINAPGAMIAGPALSMWLLVAWGVAADRMKPTT
jgi:hypothetical protein